MAKRRDKNDSTMDISASQLVPGKRPPVPQNPGVNKNDVSMWIGGVVGADDFAGTKKTATKSRAPLLIGLVVLLAALAGGAYYMFGRSSSSSATAPAAGPAVVDAGSSDQPTAVAPVPVDAAAELAPMDAGADAPVALVADAVSGADPAAKKKPTKKTVKKKKSATTKKRR